MFFSHSYTINHASIGNSVYIRRKHAEYIDMTPKIKIYSKLLMKYFIWLIKTFLNVLEMLPMKTIKMPL